jgi:ABC-type Fe3+/spermidine/putrescine transport system ATPase subunit
LRARIVGGVDSVKIVVTEAGLRLCCRAESNGMLDDGADVSLLLRPERVHIETPGGGTVPGQNRMAARIADVTYLGEDLHLSLDLVSGDLLRASLKNTHSTRSWAPAQAVEIVIDAADIRLLRR